MQMPCSGHAPGRESGVCQPIVSCLCPAVSSVPKAVMQQNTFLAWHTVPALMAPDSQDVRAISLITTAVKVQTGRGSRR